MSIETTNSSIPISWLSRRRFWVLFALVSIAVILSAVATTLLSYYRDVRLSVSVETTYVTGPLTDGGTRVDYFAAAEESFYPPEFRTDDNGFRLLVEKLGPCDDLNLQEAQQLYEKLDLPPTSPPELNYIEPLDFLVSYVRAEIAAGRLSLPTGESEYGYAHGYALEMADGLSVPWTLDEFPMMADWIEEQGAALDLIGEAVRKPVFCMPLIDSDNDPALVAGNVRQVYFLQAIARGFKARALYHIGIGNIDRAIDDIVSCARVGRHMEHGRTMVDYLAGISCQARAYEIGLGSSLDHQPTVQQWRRLVSELDQLPAHASLSQVREFERLAILEIVQLLSRGECEELMDVEEFAFLRDREFGINWNIVAERVNDNFDMFYPGDPLPVVNASVFNDFILRSERSRLLGDYLFSFFFASETLEEVLARTVCKENLLRITVAMLVYEKEHGTLPPAYSVDAIGDPLHSWRVLILPYLGQEELYSQIRLDEPWDSAHNQQFHAGDVSIYQCPSHPHGSGETTYAVIEGEDCAFNGGVAKRLDEFGPHSASLILVTERVNAACWMDPLHEIPVADARKGINSPGATLGLGSDHEGGIFVGFRSGGVEFISENATGFGYLHRMFDGTLDEPH